jgi:hypothetical protein
MKTYKIWVYDETGLIQAIDLTEEELENRLGLISLQNYYIPNHEAISILLSPVEPVKVDEFEAWRKFRLHQLKDTQGQERLRGIMSEIIERLPRPKVERFSEMDGIRQDSCEHCTMRSPTKCQNCWKRRKP